MTPEIAREEARIEQLRHAVLRFVVEYARGNDPAAREAARKVARLQTTVGELRAAISWCRETVQP